MEQELHTQRSWPIEKCSSLAAHDETSLPLLIHHQKDLPAATQHQVAFGPPPWSGGTAFAALRRKHEGQKTGRLETSLLATQRRSITAYMLSFAWQLEPKDTVQVQVFFLFH